MKRIVVIFILAVLFSFVALYFLKPGFVEKIWLWLVGLLGAIIAFFQKSGQWVGEQFPKILGKASAASVHEDDVKVGVVMEIYRYSRMGNRIFGLVYIDGEFVGISNENATNRLGTYSLDIKGNTVVFSDEGFSSSIIPAGKIKTSDKDVILSVDQNNQTISVDQFYNGIVERVSHWLELEKQPKLLISNQINSKK